MPADDGLTNVHKVGQRKDITGIEAERRFQGFDPPIDGGGIGVQPTNDLLGCGDTTVAVEVSIGVNGPALAEFGEQLPRLGDPSFEFRLLSFGRRRLFYRTSDQ